MTQKTITLAMIRSLNLDGSVSTTTIAACQKAHPDAVLDLQGVSLRGANLKDADLRNAQLQGADLSGTLMHNADLSRAQLEGAKLNRASLNGANLEYAVLRRAECTGTDFTGANLRMAVLEWAILREAKLQGAIDLSGVQVAHADLASASLPSMHVLVEMKAWQARNIPVNILECMRLTQQMMHADELRKTRRRSTRTR